MIGFFHFYKAFIPELSEKLLKKEANFEIEEEHKLTLHKLTNDLKNASNMSLRLPKTDKKFVIMADASFYAAGYVKMIEDYTVNEKTIQE